MICYWGPFYAIKVQQIDGVPTILANRDGLVSLAVQWLELMRSDGFGESHLHYDDAVELEPGSMDLTVGQLDRGGERNRLVESSLNGAGAYALGERTASRPVVGAGLEAERLYGALVLGLDAAGILAVSHALLSLADEEPGAGRIFGSADEADPEAGCFAVVRWRFEPDETPLSERAWRLDFRPLIEGSAADLSEAPDGRLLLSRRAQKALMPINGVTSDAGRGAGAACGTCLAPTVDFGDLLSDERRALLLGDASLCRVQGDGRNCFYASQGFVELAVDSSLSGASFQLAWGCAGEPSFSMLDSKDPQSVTIENDSGLWITR